MSHFKINLIKDKVMSKEQRRAVFLAIICSFIIYLILIVTLCYKVTDNFVKISRYKTEVRRLEDEFYQSYPKEGNILTYTNDIRARMAMQVAKLQVLDDALSKYVDLASLLERFSLSLPAGAYMNDFSIDNDARALSFNVVIPVNETGDALNTGRLISAWKRDALLMSTVDNIASSISKRQRVGGKSVSISKFSCSLLKGGL